jgi:hypothetical protein
MFDLRRGGWRAWPLVALIVACGEPAPDPGAVATPPAAPAATAAGDLDPPAVAGSFAPEWARFDPSAADESPLLTWIEPRPAVAGGGHRVRAARLTGDGWSTPVTVTGGTDLFANWADFPAAVRAVDGTFFVHWLEKSGDATYAYGPQVARSLDDGASWQRLGPLYDDTTATEHGFASWLPEGDGARAFWLDGRAMAEEGPMAIRTAHLASRRAATEGPPPNVELDDRICECCSTDAAWTDAGPVVVYRDRSPDEVRDIYRVRRVADAEGEPAWSAPAAVAADGWKIPGCPVNGPAVAADGRTVAVAWFTGVPSPRVRLAFSQDAGASFGEPILIDDGRPLGRVDLVLTDGGATALVSWMAVGAEDEARAEIRLARLPVVPRTLAEPVPFQLLATTSSARASGFPRLLRHGDALYFAWVDLTDDPATARLRVRSLPGSAEP